MYVWYIWRFRNFFSQKFICYYSEIFFWEKVPSSPQERRSAKTFIFFLNFSRINQTEPKIQLRDQIYQWSYEIHIMMMTMHLNA